MIAIVSSNARERIAFGALCHSRGWPRTECDSLRGLKRLLLQTDPKVVLTRHKLGDGYSDDIISALHARRAPAPARIIVLLERTIPAAEEARQVALGADYIHRDPIHSDVLLEYLAKFRTPATADPRPSGGVRASRAFLFARAEVDPVNRWIICGRKRRKVPPRQIELMELLAEFAGEVVTYTTLYSEILGRQFHGETSNMRVLLGQLAISFRKLGLTLRPHIKVIPKSGYRYTETPAAETGPRAARK